MKHARLVWTGLAVLVLAGTAVIAIACSDRTRASSASAAAAANAGTCSAEMAANCTPEMAAACAAHKGASAAMAKGSDCSTSGASAVTADSKGTCPYMSTGAAGNCPMHGAAAAAECSAHGAAAASASSGCSAHGTSAVSASSEHGSESACCSAKEARGAAGTSRVGIRVDAVTVGSSPSCGAHGAAGAMAHVDCDACKDKAACEAEIAQAGGRVQIVPLKNGIMYVYTALSAGQVRAVQAAVARHAERMQAVTAAADKATLCASCKQMRGAAASGKLVREVVNIESGCLTLVTSSDPRVVDQLYTLAGVPAVSRVAKS